MSDATRDIVIRTEAEVAQLRKEMEAVSKQVYAINTALAERKGAERVARWLIGISSGTVAGGVGALATKFGSAIIGMPLPK